MAEGNIEVTVTWAPADGVRMLLERAASMLTGYGELIRRDGASHVEEHHYLPEVEHVAAELRALMDATPRTCGQLGMAVVDDCGDEYGDEPHGPPEYGCCLPPGECCMPGLHFPSECHTAADYERQHGTDWREPPNATMSGPQQREDSHDRP